eukprot:CAMPEP_0119323958 /NCGR_PEP_ID=MMETSP1333-20130426/62047_1 /TAXON_ID=418940 /ORGANISM="Scyphosphaera apsteinii, Strain RCC1455" /LENGTH=54 /DNA_ID=CAMNT_0007331543 /DNA_START=844 /DNA_END=1005 /DNA_ORIENTATION=+
MRSGVSQKLASSHAGARFLHVKVPDATQNDAGQYASSCGTDAMSFAACWQREVQ